MTLEIVGCIIIYYLDINCQINPAQIPLQEEEKEDTFMKHSSIKIIIIFCITYPAWVSVTLASGAVSVFVSIAPQKYFVEKIGGDLVEVSVMVKPGASPANYEPTPKQMIALAKARVYFAIGVPFERIWLAKITASNDRMLCVHTEKGVEKIPMQSNQPGGIKDPHIWLSPPLVMIQARNILSGMVAVDPTHRFVYEANYKKFIKELVDLDAEIRGVFAGKGKGLEFVVFHPAWGYFAAAYGLKQVPVEIEGKDPKPADLRCLIQHAKKRGIKVVFVQPQFSSKSAKVVADAIGGQIVFVNPLALNWSANLRQVAAKFKAALR